MKTKTYKLFLTLVIPLLLSAITMQKAAAQATVSNFIFKQYDRYDDNDKLLFSNSSLGSISVSQVNNTHQTYYLNIYAKNSKGDNAWLVKNQLLPAQTTVCQQVAIDYKYLDITPGTAVHTVEFNYTLTSSLVVAQANPDDDIIIIGHDDSVKGTFDDHDVAGNARRRKNTFSSFNQLTTLSGAGVTPSIADKATVVKENYQNEGSALYNEFVNYAYAETTAPVADTAIGHNVPPVQEDPGKCTPGAFARSIAWLDSTYKQNINKPAQEIYDSLNKYMDTCNGNEACKIKTKSDYLKRVTGGKGITTITVIDSTWTLSPPGVPKEPRPSKPTDFIKDNLKNCDVELAYTYTENGTLKAHIVTVTRIQCASNGCCTIWYRDDEDQKDKNKGDGCEKSITICNSQDTFRVNGVLCKLYYLVKECISGTSRTVTDNKKLQGNTPVIALLQNTPNPFGSSTTIGIQVQEGTKVGVAQLIIRNAQGNEVQRIRLNLKPGLNNIPYQRGRDAKGLLYYSLQVDGQTIATRQMMTELQ